MNVKRLMRPLLLLVLFILFQHGADSQIYRGQSEISVSCGFFSAEEMANQTLLGGEDQSSYVTNSTGNIFVTYRYFLSPRLAIGGAIGTVSFKGSSWSDVGNSSSFDYRYTTIAPELLFNFVDRKSIRAYTYLGAGYSFVEGQITDAYHSQPSQPQIISRGSFNAHYVPIGISVGDGGDGLSAFVEVGIGYKGIFHGGLSLKFGKRKLYAYERVTVNNGDVVLVPRDYLIDSSFEDLGSVKTIMPPHGEVHDYYKYIEQVSAKTKCKNGNVFIPDKIIEKSPDRYTHINGEAFYVHDKSRLQNQVQNKIDSLRGQQFAYIIVYCTDNRPAGMYPIKINEGVRQILHPRSKYAFRVDSEGTYKISCGTQNIIFVDVKFGNNYYVKYYLSGGKGHSRTVAANKFKIVNAESGALESATMKHDFYINLEATKQ